MPPSFRMFYLIRKRHWSTMIRIAVFVKIDGCYNAALIKIDVFKQRNFWIQPNFTPLNEHENKSMHCFSIRLPVIYEKGLLWLCIYQNGRDNMCNLTNAKINQIRTLQQVIWSRCPFRLVNIHQITLNICTKSMNSMNCRKMRLLTVNQWYWGILLFRFQ